jgi:hypothetical protein
VPFDKGFVPVVLEVLIENDAQVVVCEFPRHTTAHGLSYMRGVYFARPREQRI